MLIAFFALGFAFAQANRRGETKMAADRLAKIVVTGVVTGILIIGAFYLIAD